MKTRSIPWIFWVLVASVLIAAAGRHPYSFYEFVRFIASASAVVLIFSAVKQKWTIQVWSLGFAMITVLFNPLWPIHLNRFVWPRYDIAAGLFFLGHLAFVRLGGFRALTLRGSPPRPAA